MKFAAVALSEAKGKILGHNIAGVNGQRLFRKYAVQYLLLKTLDRDSRKEILKERPSGEFLELLNQVYVSMA